MPTAWVPWAPERTLREKEPELPTTFGRQHTGRYLVGSVVYGSHPLGTTDR